MPRTSATYPTLLLVMLLCAAGLFTGCNPVKSLQSTQPLMKEIQSESKIFAQEAIRILTSDCSKGFINDIADTDLFRKHDYLAINQQCKQAEATLGKFVQINKLEGRYQIEKGVLGPQARIPFTIQAAFERGSADIQMEVKKGSRWTVSSWHMEMHPLYPTLPKPGRKSTTSPPPTLPRMPGKPNPDLLY